MDPVAALSLSRNDAIRPIAAEVRSRMERVLNDVSSPAAAR
jgi:hypothetical protein